MDKQKEIEKMARKICKSSSNGCNFPTCSKCGIKDTCKARTYATRAVNGGYGDVKQAVREFAEKLKNTIIEDTAYGCDSNQHTGYYDYTIKIGDIPEYIDKLVKEVCGE